MRPVSAADWPVPRVHNHQVQQATTMVCHEIHSVLIVDDSPVFRSVLHRLLSSLRTSRSSVWLPSPGSQRPDHRPSTQRYHPDVNAALDGITFLKRLMRQPTPVVMISSYTRENSLAL
jgi:chemotaxis response regulator CheB